MKGERAHAIQGVSSFLSLLLLFVSAFSVPLGVLLWGSDLVYLFVDGADPDPSSLELFPKHAKIQTGGDFITVEHSPGLQPAIGSGKDFLFYTWFRIKKFPPEGKAITFVAKVDSNHPSGRGYSFGMVRQGGVLRPQLYWRAGDGTGETRVFSEFSLVPRSWMVLGFGFFDEKFLAVYGGSLAPDGTTKMQFLGGHELESPIIASSESPLVLGAKKNGLFRGQLGPFGIIQREELKEGAGKIIEEILEAPQRIPESIDSRDVILFVPAVNEDRSSSKHPVKVRGIAGFVVKENRKKENGTH